MVWVSPPCYEINLDVFGSQNGSWEGGWKKGQKGQTDRQNSVDFNIDVHINIRHPVPPVQVYTLQMHRVVAFLKK